MKARRIEELVYSNYVHNNYPFQGKHQPTSTITHTCRDPQYRV